MIPSTTEEKAAQLLFPRLGSNMKPSITAEDDLVRALHLVESCPVGGFVLFNGDASRTPETLARLQRASRFPLLIGADMERGAGQQLRGATVFPHAFAFDALKSGVEELIEETAAMSAEEALACGLHITFSPVADVHSNPDNPIISIRCFGSEPKAVSSRVAAYIRGCRRAGMLSTAKHFPGHGDTNVDSHEAVPVVEKSKQKLERMELPPFEAAIDAGVDLAMTAHVAYPGLDPSGKVATESQPILTSLLRNRMGFEGAVITDSLLMEGARASDEQWPARLIAAGVDILLDIPDAPAALGSILRALEKGRLPEKRLEQAFSRVWELKSRMKARFGDDVFLRPAAAAPASRVGSVEHGKMALDVARRATRIVSGSPENVRCTADALRKNGLLVLLVRPHVTYNDPTAGSLGDILAHVFDHVVLEEIGPDLRAGDIDGYLEAANRFACVTVAVVVKPAAWHRFGLLPEQKILVERLTRRRAVVLGALGSPRALDDFPDAALALCTYSDVNASNRAFVSRLRSILI